jgi:hypothetical protein
VAKKYKEGTSEIRTICTCTWNGYKEDDGDFLQLPPTTLPYTEKKSELTAIISPG